MNKLLLIEDDRVFANIYCKKFASEGHEVTVADDGQDGLAKIFEVRPDIVILDLMLPKLGGVEILKKVRATRGFETLPIIVFSNAFMSSLIEAAWAAGATKVLIKADTSPRKLAEMVQELMVPDQGGTTMLRAAAVTPPREDPQVQKELLPDFLASLPLFLEQIRSLHDEVLRVTEVARRQELLERLRHCLHLLAGNAGLVGNEFIARISAVHEALIKELHDKPDSINASTLRTSTQAVFFLTSLLQRADSLPDYTGFDPRVLAVDDEEFSRRALQRAITLAGVRGEAVDSALTAKQEVRNKQFDLVLLDVDMPVMDGYQFCAQLRALSAYRDTPVIFVTGLTDFQSRTRSSMSGGDDFIAKPFVFVELSVKILIHVMKARLAAERST